MQEVFIAVRFLKVRVFIGHLYTVSRKRPYKDLLSVLFPPPLYRSLYSDFPGHDVLKRVRKMYVSPDTKTFFYKLHTDTLPVKLWLQRKGIFVYSVNCRFCDVPETVEHCFISCKDAILFWNILHRTVKKYFKINSHTIRYLLPTSLDEVPFDMFFVMRRHSLWKTRMQDRNAELTTASSMPFMRMALHLKDIYEELDIRPDWHPILMKCSSLPASLCDKLRRTFPVSLDLHSIYACKHFNACAVPVRLLSPVNESLRYSVCDNFKYPL